MVINFCINTRLVYRTSMLDSEKLHVGEVLSRISYMRVVSINGDMVTVKNDKGLEWNIGKGILAAEASSSSQFEKTEKVTRTELARILEQDVRDCAFSVCFTKLPDVNDQVGCGGRAADPPCLGYWGVPPPRFPRAFSWNFCKSSQNTV